MRVLLRPLCWLRGHINAAWMLPEEVFGLYAYSRLYCSRCGEVFEDRTRDLRRANPRLGINYPPSGPPPTVPPPPPPVSR